MTMTFGYTTFDAEIGTSGIAWSERGIVGVQLPEKTEAATRARMLRRFPDAVEQQPPPEIASAIEAIRAGMDLIEICHSPELILRAYEALIGEAERSTAFRTLLVKRTKRSAQLLAQHFKQSTPSAYTAKQFVALKNEINRFTATVAALQPGPKVVKA